MEDNAIRHGREGILVTLRAHPSSSRSKLETATTGRIEIYLNSPPQKGKANKEAVSILAEALGIPTGSIRITKGERSRDKTFLVSGIGLEDVRSRLLG